MRPVSYQVIERQVATRLGWNPNELDADQFGVIRDAISSALEYVWRYTAWTDLTRTQQRAFAETYSLFATYSAGAIVYHIASSAYYVCLATTTGDEPATLVDGSWEIVNAGFWALAEREYSAEEWDATVTYDEGDQVFYSQTGKHYACKSSNFGNTPDEGGSWAELIPFHPYIPWTQTDETPIGEILGMYWSDPRTYPGARPVAYKITHSGVEPAVVPYPARPWIQFTLRPHRFTGDAFDTSVAYTAVDLEDSTSETTPVSSSGTDTSGTGYSGVGQLRARTSHGDGNIAYLLYVTTDGDGGEGWFRYKASSTTADDGVDVLQPNDIVGVNPGRWHRTS